MIIKYEPGIYEVVKGGYRFDGIWRDGICRKDNILYKFFLSWNINEDCYQVNLEKLSFLDSLKKLVRLI